MKTSYIVVVALFFLLGLAGIIVDPVTTVGVLTSLIPLIVALSIISVAYLVAIYFGLEPPRSPFYRMLLGSLVLKVAIGSFIGLFALAGLAHWNLPGTEEQRRAFVVLLIAVLLTPPIFYAATIYTGRRDATRQSGDRTLD